MQPDSRNSALSFEPTPESGIKTCFLTLGKSEKQKLRRDSLDYTNKVLTQKTKEFLGPERKLVIKSFLILVCILTFENPLTPGYTGLIFQAISLTLKEAYNLVCKNYVIYVKREQDEEVKVTSKWNPFAVEAKKKEPSLVESLEVKIK
ncbi:hypothetical protein DSO57_1010709 [Entomophthora muscae]|uniref:Uncharacterized protein n=1 Tax=Entomophthora muscae TaxID=34485 RepID=A0ACC2U4Q5_9FUNG|nr:hypothetical protein DSO57_1010709 [Entomophthora muscae]